MRDQDLVVIGGGTAGLVASIGAAGLGARVVLVERERTGGDCLWTGCVPSKALVAAARRAHGMRTADAVGLDPVDPVVDLAAVLRHVHGARDTIAPHDSPERLRGEGVVVLHGEARLLGAGRVQVTDPDGTRSVLRSRAVLIATGSRPALPPLDGLVDADPLTTDTLWDLDRLPARLVVLGGGAVGCELGQAFRRLGSDVTLVEALPHLLDDEEPEAREVVAGVLRREGVALRFGAPAVGVEVHRDGVGVLIVADGTTLAFDRLLVAAGREPVTDGLGLADVGVATTVDGWVAVDRRLRTSVPGVYAAGDVTGGRLLTSVAALEGSLVVTDALLGIPRPASRSRVPRVVFTDPEVAHLGLTEAEARERHGDVTVAGFDLADLDRAVTSGATDGYVKLVGDGRGRLVGATIVGEAAGEAIAEIAAWMHGRGRIADVARAVHAYPTFAEGSNRAALDHLRAAWLGPRTRRVTRPLLALLRGLHRLRRRIGP